MLIATLGTYFDSAAATILKVPRLLPAHWSVDFTKMCKYYKGMMACCPKCYCDDAAFKASIDADIKTGSEAPYNCKDLKCDST